MTFRLCHVTSLFELHLFKRLAVITFEWFPPALVHINYAADDALPQFAFFF